MNFWRRSAQNRLLDVGAAAIALMSIARIAWVQPKSARMSDFAHYYLASKLLWQGQSPYTVSLASLYESNGFVQVAEMAPAIAPNPPPFYWLFSPLVVLGPRAAYVVWLGLEVISLCLILVLTRRLLRDRLSPRGWRFVCAATLSSATVYWHLYYAQVGLLLAAMVLAAYNWHRMGNHTAACLTVATAGLLKLYPFLLLPWFVWRSAADFRGRATRAAIVLAFVSATIFVTPASLWQDYFRYGWPTVAAGPINRTFNYAVPSFVANLGYAATGFSGLQDTTGGWWAVGVSMGLMLIGAAYLLCLFSGQDAETQFCLLSVAMLAGSATAWGHYFVFLIFPMAVAAVRVAGDPSPGRVVWLVAILLLLNYMGTLVSPFLNRHIYLKILANNLPLYGLLALGCLFAHQLQSCEQERL